MASSQGQAEGGQKPGPSPSGRSGDPEHLSLVKHFNLEKLKEHSTWKQDLSKYAFKNCRQLHGNVVCSQ